MSISIETLSIQIEKTPKEAPGNQELRQSESEPRSLEEVLYELEFLEWANPNDKNLNDQGYWINPNPKISKTFESENEHSNKESIFTFYQFKKYDDYEEWWNAVFNSETSEFRIQILPAAIKDIFSYKNNHILFDLVSRISSGTFLIDELRKQITQRTNNPHQRIYLRANCLHPLLEIQRYVESNPGEIIDYICSVQQQLEKSLELNPNQSGKSKFCGYRLSPTYVVYGSNDKKANKKRFIEIMQEHTYGDLSIDTNIHHIVNQADINNGRIKGLPCCVMPHSLGNYWILYTDDHIDIHQNQERIEAEYALTT